MIFYTIASKVAKVPDVKVSAAGEVHVSAPVEEAGLLGRHPRQLPGLAPVIVVDLLVVGDVCRVVLRVIVVESSAPVTPASASPSASPAPAAPQSPSQQTPGQHPGPEAWP